MKATLRRWYPFSALGTMFVGGALVQGYLTARENFAAILACLVVITLLAVGHRWADYHHQEFLEQEKTKRLIQDQPRGLNDAG